MHLKHKTFPLLFYIISLQFHILLKKTHYDHHYHHYYHHHRHHHHYYYYYHHHHHYLLHSCCSGLTSKGVDKLIQQCKALQSLNIGSHLLHTFIDESDESDDEDEEEDDSYDVLVICLW